MTDPFDPTEEIRQIIDRISGVAFDAGFTAGVQAASQPWQNIATAPRDGTTVIIGLGKTRGLGYWSAQSASWKQHGTGRVVLPSIWMVLPTLPGVK